MPPKNSGGLTKFPGGRKVINRTAQTAFVRVVTPRFASLKLLLTQSLKLMKKSQNPERFFDVFTAIKCIVSLFGLFRRPQ